MFVLNRKFSLLFIAALATGIMVAASIPGAASQNAGFSYFLPIAFVPLLVAFEALPTQGQSSGVRSYAKAMKMTPLLRSLLAFLLAWVAGACTVAFSGWWVITPLIQFGRFSYPAAYCLFAAMVSLAGLFMPVLLFPFIIETGRSARKISHPLPGFAMVCLSVCAEYFLPPPFRNILGGNFLFSEVLNQWHSLFGSSFLSLLILGGNYWFARSLFMQPRVFLRALFSTLVVVLLWFCAYGLGLWRLSLMEKALANLPLTSIGVVQPGYTFAEKASRSAQFPKAKAQSLENLITLTRKIVAEKPDFIVWPESAVSREFLTRAEDLAAVKAFAVEINIPILVQADEQDGENLRSSSFLIRPDGSKTASYYKRKLAPFGEWVPLEERFPWWGAFVRGQLPLLQRWTAGDNFQTTYYNPDIRLASLISYDVTDTRLAMLLSNEGGAGVLVVQSNFSWMGSTHGGLYFKEQARLRGLENARSVVFASNSGFSSVFDPFGREVFGPTPLFTERAEIVKIPVQGNGVFVETFYAKFGDTPLLLLGAASILSILIHLSRKQRG